MLTHCPSCRTTFRVTPLQIKARSGKVRCGQCHFVFNAIDTLADEVVIEKTALPPSDEVLNPPPEPDLPEESFVSEAAEESTAVNDAATTLEFEEGPQTTAVASVSEEFDESSQSFGSSIYCLVPVPISSQLKTLIQRLQDALSSLFSH